jgi:CRISPR-associated protein Csx16
MVGGVTTFFISRHPGALQWMTQAGLAFDEWAPHFDPTALRAGDTVIGTLPVHQAAQVCHRGARYVHLALDLPEQARGRELSADDMDRYSARLEPYVVVAVA